MKQNFNKFLVFLLAIMITVVSYAQRTNSNHVYVRGYTRSNGTYVQPHYRTAPNSTNRDNFSTSGNVNPYTGKAGWIAPDNKPLTLPETNNYPSTSIYSYPTSTSTSVDLEYEKFKRDLELERTRNSQRNDDYMLKMPAYTPSSSSYNYNYNYNYNSTLKDYNSFSPDETVMTVSKSVRSSINYHNRYSWEDKMILEKALNKLGYSVESIDGDIDESTIDAIKEFQRDNGLNADGKAGDMTVKKMALILRE